MANNKHNATKVANCHLKVLISISFFWPFLFPLSEWGCLLAFDFHWQNMKEEKINVMKHDANF